MKNKRGLSAIVTSVIMIVLVMLAIGAVWSIISNVLEEGSEKVALSSLCLKLNIKATKVLCGGADNGICNITIKRTTGGKEIGGVKLIFASESGEDTYVEDVPGNLNPLETRTKKEINTGLINPNKVEMVPYILDESENEQLCPTTTSYEF